MATNVKGIEFDEHGGDRMLDEYVSKRNGLIPEAERMADSAVLATPGMAEEEARALWNLTFHLWMDRLCAEKIHGRGWPR